MPDADDLDVGSRLLGLGWQRFTGSRPAGSQPQAIEAEQGMMGSGYGSLEQQALARQEKRQAGGN
ncbi:MAG: hypothetical protein ERJ67_06845 [Aphanocapsa feldmannii 277cV]|uniref:Uncharacterized protein n=2 Tax=Aphanocapsa feldmannii TaxID=192050 RepID=A0A524RMM2_9CHRO|nr:MAG: hypothetical protein ERJ67_06845 [Aphanocapsa feldmannii 277cV]TGH20267.1 MAG: hypothetical protein ERJ68_07120 [Aphanocapsa feldmannii 277cI]